MIQTNSEHNLFEKTELQIDNIEFQSVNVTVVAEVVADALTLNREEVIVIDVRDHVLSLDILRESIDPYLIVGKQKQILDNLSMIPGITISDKTKISSNGMLGWIALDQNEAFAALDRSKLIVQDIRRKMAKRALIFSTGTEVISGQIEDTNKPEIMRRLEVAGYNVKAGETLKDDRDFIIASLNHAVNTGGYGLIITTGGVGAEDKDHSIEALLGVDPTASTPYIAKIEQGKGRHLKDGIRIGVGQIENTMIVALPGPHDEVKIAMDVLVEGLNGNRSKETLAQNIVKVLRDKYRNQYHYCSQ